MREFKFHNSKQVHHGIPIIASNMDTVGTFEMAKALGAHKCYTCIHKYYSIDDWRQFAASNKEVMPYVAASSGTGMFCNIFFFKKNVKIQPNKNYSLTGANAKLVQ